MVGHLHQAHARQQVQRQRTPVRASRQRKRHVLPRTQMRKQRIPLRQIADGTMLRRQAVKRFATGGQQASDGAQKCRLAFTALPEQDGKALDLEAGL